MLPSLRLQSNQVATVHAGRRKLADVPIDGYSANVSSLLNLDLQAGRFFTPAEEQHAAPVAVIGTDVKDQLFEVEFYPRFRPGTYAFVSVGIAPSQNPAASK